MMDRSHLSIVPMPDVLLCSNCRAHAVQIGGELCPRCEESQIAQDANALMRIDIEILINALEQAASTLEASAQRTRTESTRRTLSRAAEQARVIIVCMWEKYQ